MDLQTVVAAPFRHRGTNELTESEFIATVSMELDWYTPEQARRIIDLATGEGLLAQNETALVPTFDVETVQIPAEPTPDESVLTKRSVFEEVLEAITDAGHDKQAAVAEINSLQRELGVTSATAGVLYARQHGIAVTNVIDRLQTDLTEPSASDR